MNSITTTNSPTSNILTSLLDPTTSAASSSHVMVDPQAQTTSGDPVDVVDLSDRAKQILARANAEQVAADKLSGLLQSLKDPDDTSASSHDSSKGQASLFDKLRGRWNDSTDSTTWTAGSKFGDASISDSDFNSKIQDSLRAALADFPPEKRAALDAAIANGTLKIQKGSEVEGYNTRTTITYNVGPGGGQGMSTSGYRPPTGAAKDAIDSGNAVGLWTADRATCSSVGDDEPWRMLLAKASSQSGQKQAPHLVTSDREFWRVSIGALSSFAGPSQLRAYTGSGLFAKNVLRSGLSSEGSPNLNQRFRFMVVHGFALV